MFRQPQFELEPELEQELENGYQVGLESEEEATELEPLFRQAGDATQSTRWLEREQALACPGPSSQTVSGFPRYQNSVRSLPPVEQQKIRSIARLISQSFQPGCPPIRTVRLVGHADRDVQRGAVFEKRISAERALAVQQALKQLISNPAISSRIAWDAGGVGATSLVVPNPRNEAERARNRRVEIWLDGKGPDPSNPDYIRWVQSCLNQVLGTSLAVTGVMEPRTRSAIRAFQQRQGLAVNGIINPQTVAAFINFCGFPLIRPVGPAVKMRSVSRCGVTSPHRWVGNGGDNIREDVQDTMDRLHLLWSLSNADYSAEYPGVSALPLGSIVPLRMIPLTTTAIGRNFDPTLAPAVAAHFLNLALSDPVGCGQTNNKNDILALQVPLRALGRLGEPDFTAESTAVTSLTTPTVPDASIPKTLAAVTDLKDAIAGGRLGWRPIRADEVEAGGDRFGGQTFDFTISSLSHYPPQDEEKARTLVEPFDVSIFVPRGARPGVNKVHVFFSPGDATGDTGFNAVLSHGLRFASDASEWILIGIPTVPSNTEGGWRTIDMARILACLDRAGRSARIDALRLTGHSRGGLSLRESLLRGLSTSGIERIVLLDCGEFFTGAMVNAWTRRGTSVVHYRVINKLPLAGANVINLGRDCLRAIAYSRLIQDAMVTRPDVASSIPGTINSQLLPLPPRGQFTTSATSSPGQPNIRMGCNPRARTCFCHDQRTSIDRIIKQEHD